MAPTTEQGYLKMLLNATEDPPPAIARYLKMAEPVFKILGMVFDVVAPLYIGLFNLGYSAYQWLPVDLFTSLMGAGLCFCGGAYVTSIAAIEAFRQCGWETTRAALLDVYEDAQRIKAAYDADNKKDDDGDGVSDVKDLKPTQLMQRRLAIAATAVKDPEKLSAAIGGLWAAWLGVQGVLRFQFAKTITLAVSMAESVTPLVMKVAVPITAHVVPPKYHHWVPTIIRTVVKAIAVAIAWRLQVIQSAMQSALRGGLMCTRALLRWAKSTGKLSIDADDTYIDEITGYALAAFGFYCQFEWGFGMPFPLNLIMFPFTIVEWYIRWTITS